MHCTGVVMIIISSLDSDLTCLCLLEHYCTIKPRELFRFIKFAHVTAVVYT